MIRYRGSSRNGEKNNDPVRGCDITIKTSVKTVLSVTIKHVDTMGNQ